MIGNTISLEGGDSDRLVRRETWRQSRKRGRDEKDREWIMKEDKNQEKRNKETVKSWLCGKTGE
jgi:deoxyribodipyrimidine photolyase